MNEKYSNAKHNSMKTDFPSEKIYFLGREQRNVFIWLFCVQNWGTFSPKQSKGVGKDFFLQFVLFK